MTGKRKTEAKRWFQQAYYDLKATRWNIQGGFYDTACFLAQQAGEKALKSFLYFQGARRTIQDHFRAAGESEILQLDEEEKN